MSKAERKNCDLFIQVFLMQELVLPENKDLGTDSSEEPFYKKMEMF